jgi:hypothetical protein
MQIENTTASLVIDGEIDTNVEFLAEEKKEQSISVLGHVFKSIFVEIPKDFILSIWGFFKRYFVHYIESFKFFNKPSLKVPPFDKKDFKENTQHSFEIALIITAILLFLIKQDAIPVNKDLQEKYGNDLIQMFFEFFIFIIFAAAYAVLIVVSVLSGRLMRALFKIPVTRGESDILFAYLNNSFFSISALLAFFFRCSMQYDQIEGTGRENGLIVFCVFITLLLTIWWSFKFARFNKLPIIKRLLFHIISIAWFTTVFGIGMSAICLFIIGS